MATKEAGKKETSYQNYMRTATKEIKIKDAFALQKKILDSIRSHAIFKGIFLNPSVLKKMPSGTRKALQEVCLVLDKSHEAVHDQFYKMMEFKDLMGSFNSFRDGCWKNFKSEIQKDESLKKAV